MSEAKPETPADKPEGMREHFAQWHEQVVAKIQALVDILDAEYVFQALTTYHLSRLSGGYREEEHGDIPALIELGAFHLYPRFGLGGSREPEKIQATLDALAELNKLRGLYTAFSVDTENKNLEALQVHLRIHSELVRGSSYPPQTRRRIENIQRPFEAWFRVKAGIGPGRTLEILDVFEVVINENFRKRKEQFQSLSATAAKFHARMQKRPSSSAGTDTVDHEGDILGNQMAEWIEGMPLMLAPSFSQVVEKIPTIQREEWNALQSLIGLTPSSRLAIQHPREIQDRPVYFLSNERFILVDLGSVYDAVFAAFDRLTRTDSVFRDKQYVPQMSRWMERETYDYFLRLFPASNVYHGLTYPDPDKLEGETELDVAVSWGPFLVLIEVKGKQFRPKSRLGDPSRLYDDLKDNVEEAFEQASRAMRYVEANPTATFTEKNSGRKLALAKNTLRRIFPVSVTLHHFAGLTTQLALLKHIGLFKDSAYPWSVSLADLDTVTHFAGSPDVFLHYVQRRLDLQRSEKGISGDELDLFGLYLDTRLHPSQFWERKTDDGQDFSMIHLSGGSERFDQWFQAEQGMEVERPVIQLKLPSNFAAIIQELRCRDDDGARWIAFALLGMSQEGVKRCEQDLEGVRRLAKQYGRVPRVTFKDGDFVISIMAAHGLPTDQLRKWISLRTELEKYRLRTTASAGIAINVEDVSKSFDFAVWIEGPWEYDGDLETILKKERPTALPTQKLPGRNDLCFCGSGKKFKKCCIEKVRIVPK